MKNKESYSRAVSAKQSNKSDQDRQRQYIESLEREIE